MRISAKTLGASALIVGMAMGGIAAPADAKLRVVVTSKPIHALVAAVMGEAGSPSVLVSGTASPHSYAMKPSDVQAANDAQLLFRVSASLEPFTAKLASSLPAGVRVVSLIDAPGLDLLDRRETGPFEAHDHAHEHTAGKHAAAEEDERDPHIWLDPRMASTLVDHIAAVLADAEPASAAVFQRNAASTKADLERLDAEMADALKPYAGRPFIVLHDAYQYLERRFGLSAVGSISVNPETPPSGKRLSAIRRKVRETGAACVFAEPGMQPKVVAAVIEGTPARRGELDPEATRLPPASTTYATLMRQLAGAFKACFDGR